MPDYILVADFVLVGVEGVVEELGAAVFGGLALERVSVF